MSDLNFKDYVFIEATTGTCSKCKSDNFIKIHLLKKGDNFYLRSFCPDCGDFLMSILDSANYKDTFSHLDNSSEVKTVSGVAYSLFNIIGTLLAIGGLLFIFLLILALLIT